VCLCRYDNPPILLLTLKTLSDFLSQPINNAPLVVWRICFGVLMLAESWGAILTGWVRKNLIEPEFTFSFIGFEWLQPLPGNGMYGYFFVMALAALGVALGWRYRISAILLALLWSGAYFMQKLLDYSFRQNPTLDRFHLWCFGQVLSRLVGRRFH